MDHSPEPASGQDGDTNRSELSLGDLQQESSPFLQLPRELRLDIYDILLASTRLTHGSRFVDNVNGPSGWTSITPRRHSLAIVYVCRKIHQEIRHYWPQRVLLNFETQNAMLHTISRAASSILAHLRHVRVRFEVWSGPGSRPRGARLQRLWNQHLQGLLEVLRCLRLDTLTVFGPFITHIAQYLLSRLVQEGQGWRELRFVTPDSGMISWASIEAPGPSLLTRWESMVSARDEREGRPAGSSTVVVYQALDVPGMLGVQPPIFCPEHRRIVHLDPFRPVHDRLLSTAAWRPEMMVVVRWGGIRGQRRPSRRPADLP